MIIVTHRELTLMFNTSVRYFPVYSLAPYSDNLYTEKGARGRQEEGIGEKDGGRR